MLDANKYFISKSDKYYLEKKVGELTSIKLYGSNNLDDVYELFIKIYSNKFDTDEELIAEIHSVKEKGESKP